MRILLAAACAVLLSAPALALQPATTQFLSELKPAIPADQVSAVAADVVNGKSLDTLAAKRDETGVRSFVATRNFIRAFRKDSNADFPADDLYNIGYLTAAEKLFIATKLAEAFPPAKTKRA